MRCNPWRWLWGLIPIAMLSWITYHWERGAIESDLGARARQALDQQGMDWAEISFAGRDGLLRGRAPDEAEPKRAGDIVRQLPGVRLVNLRTDLSPKPDVFSWLATHNKGKLVLSGYVPSEAARKSMLAIAKANFPKSEIEDAMQIARGAPAIATWSGGTSFALRQLAQLKKGTADLSGTSLTIGGEATDSAAYKSVRAALAKLPSGIRLSAENVTPAVVSPFAWSAKLADDKLVLTGHVPNEKVREDVFGMAKRRFDKLTVVDRMEVAGGEPDGWSKAVKSALEQLSMLEDASLETIAGELKISGVAPDEPAADAIRKALRSAVPGTFKVSDAITVREPPQPDPAEIEAQRLAEEDARRKAEEDRLRTEREAEERRLADLDAEARMKAEAEARAKADEEARQKSEDEARQRADAEAKRKADADARERKFLEFELAWGAKNDEYERKRLEEEERRKAAVLVQEQRIAEANKCQAMMRAAAAKGQILFNHDSSVIDAKSAPTLLELSRIATACPEARVEISGHTDAEGDSAYNKALSERRAKAIVEYLSKEGVDARRLSAMGYGEDRPVAPNDTGANKAKNRRIEFSVVH